MTNLLDGDSKSYTALIESNVYADMIEIKKEECINHVSKRMGKAPLNLVDQCKN